MFKSVSVVHFQQLLSWFRRGEGFCQIFRSNGRNKLALYIWTRRKKHTENSSFHFCSDIHKTSRTLSDHFNATGPNNSCFSHHQQRAADIQFDFFLAFSATTMVLYKHTVTTAKEKLKYELLGPRAQLKQTLITTMVTKWNKYHHLNNVRKLHWNKHEF